MTNIVNVGYRSTNYYAVDISAGKLLVDCGWPGTLPEFTAVLRRKGVDRSEIRYILCTHFHPDHAGLVEEMKQAGALLMLMESQRSAPQAAWKPDTAGIPTVIPISSDRNIELAFSGSRNFLSSLGLQGEILPTPGHSPDSITLVLDEGFVFTGDLPARFMVAGDDEVIRGSWDRIDRHHIAHIFPAHGS